MGGAPGRLEALLGPFGAVSGPSEGFFGPPSGDLGALSGRLGRSTPEKANMPKSYEDFKNINTCCLFGTSWGSSWGRLWPFSGDSGAVSGPTWTVLPRLVLSCLTLSCLAFEATLSRPGGHLGPSQRRGPARAVAARGRGVGQGTKRPLPRRRTGQRHRARRGPRNVREVLCRMQGAAGVWPLGTGQRVGGGRRCTRRATGTGGGIGEREQGRRRVSLGREDERA